MEHINENTIRVLIKNEDLAARGITMLDLMGNQKDIENFFYSILEEVDAEAQFKDSDSVTFQVLPSKNGLELFISKNLNLPEDLPFIDMEDFPEDFNPEEFQDFLKHQIENDALVPKSSKEAVPESTWLESPSQVFLLENFEDVVFLAENVQIDEAFTNLYAYGQDYYLELVYQDDTVTDFEKKIHRALMLEYSKPAKFSGQYLLEHGKLIMEHSAVELTRYYFNN